MCSLGLLVGIFSAAAPQEAPTDRPVVVRFKNGPVIAAHGIPPYLTSGFEVQERNESRFWKPPQGKADEAQSQAATQTNEAGNEADRWIYSQRNQIQRQDQGSTETVDQA